MVISNNLFISTPFAENGDLETIPVEEQSDGSVSYNSGFPELYSKEVGIGKDGKRIQREDFNGLQNATDTAIQAMQKSSISLWVSPDDNVINGTPTAISYLEGTPALFEGQVFWAKKLTEVQPTIGADWSLFAPQPVASTTVAGIISVQSVLNSTAQYVAASLYAVKQAYDKGVAALAKANTASTAAAAAQNTANGAVSSINGSFDNMTIQGVSIGATGGSYVMSRSGNIVTICGYLTHPSASAFTTASNAIPSWARPNNPDTVGGSGANQVSNCYYANTGGPKTISIVGSTLRMAFNYKDYAGSTSYNTSTYNFSISYPV